MSSTGCGPAQWSATLVQGWPVISGMTACRIARRRICDSLGATRPGLLIIVKRLAALSFILASQWAQADCTSSLPLEGVVSVETCMTESADCRPAFEALHEYASTPDDDPAMLTIALQTSPWRMYDPDFRILSVPEFAVTVRQHIKDGVKSVRLDGSWTAVSPGKDAKSLAHQLSDALDGFPVTGLDGFMWVASNGRTRTTKQAFTVKKGVGPYSVPTGAEVMAALVAGWPSEMQDHFVENGDAEGVMRAGVGWDVYYLCPERTLSAFELAAKMGSPIGAYNAAVMHLERAGDGDRQAAMVLLTRAVELKDAKAAQLLAQLRNPTVGKPAMH